MRAAGAERPPGRTVGGATRRQNSFEQALSRYRDITTKALLESIPAKGPPHLYDLVSAYPRRLGKGLRAGLCLATCSAYGGNEQQALNSAVAVELFHNGFLIHDDVQDDSEARRGAPTLHREHGIGIAVNVGNATNLLALRRIMENRQMVGPDRSSAIVEETERMMRHSLEGQAIELGWIRDNVCQLESSDYLRMCLKKTSWYSFIYPMRVGATVALGAQPQDRFCQLGWYVGAAFQIQDDILNLTGEYARYRKEIGGDLREGKRTLMLIRLLNVCTRRERRTLERYLATAPSGRTHAGARRILDMMASYDTIDFARRCARQLAGAALVEALAAFRGVPDSPSKQFILETVLYTVNRDR